MSQIVKIIAAKPFDYSHDNGITLLQYLPGQIYEVPDSSIRGLSRRNAIEILDRAEVDAELAQAHPAGTLVGEGAAAGSEGANDGDEGGEGGKDDKSAADAKAKDDKAAADAAKRAEEEALAAKKKAEDEAAAKKAKDDAAAAEQKAADEAEATAKKKAEAAAGKDDPSKPNKPTK